PGLWPGRAGSASPRWRRPTAVFSWTFLRPLARPKERQAPGVPRSDPRPCIPRIQEGVNARLTLPAEVGGQDALSGIVSTDAADHLAVLRLDTAAADLAVDHAADERVEAGDEIAVDRRRRVRIADPAVVGQEQIARLGRRRHRAHRIFG